MASAIARAEGPLPMDDRLDGHASLHGDRVVLAAYA
jgi:hypothetical protein